MDAAHIGGGVVFKHTIGQVNRCIVAVESAAATGRIFPEDVSSHMDAVSYVSTPTVMVGSVILKDITGNNARRITAVITETTPIKGGRVGD